jgi:hypothetical protein
MTNKGIKCITVLAIAFLIFMLFLDVFLQEVSKIKAIVNERWQIKT